MANPWEHPDLSSNSTHGNHTLAAEISIDNNPDRAVVALERVRGGGVQVQTFADIANLHNSLFKPHFSRFYVVSEGVTYTYIGAKDATTDKSDPTKFVATGNHHFSEHSPYVPGNLALHQGAMYVCAQPHTGPWDANHFSAIKTINNTFMPRGSGADDTAAFEAYAAQQKANGHPIYFYDPANQGFYLNNLSNSANYATLVWIGIGDSTNGAPVLNLSGNCQLLVGTGTNGISLNVLTNAQVTLQGYSEHTKQRWAEVSITGNNATLSFYAVNTNMARLKVDNIAVNASIHVQSRTHLSMQNLEIGTSPAAVYIEDDCTLHTRWGEGNIAVGFNGSQTKDRSHLMFNRWRSGTISVHGSDAIIMGSGATIDVKATANNCTILGQNTVADAGTDTQQVGGGSVDISGKQDKHTGATPNHVAIMDNQGNSVGSSVPLYDVVRNTDLRPPRSIRGNPEKGDYEEANIILDPHSIAGRTYGMVRGLPMTNRRDAAHGTMRIQAGKLTHWAIGTAYRDMATTSITNDSTPQTCFPADLANCFSATGKLPNDATTPFLPKGAVTHIQKLLIRSMINISTDACTYAVALGGTVLGSLVLPASASGTELRRVEATVLLSGTESTAQFKLILQDLTAGVSALASGTVATHVDLTLDITGQMQAGATTVATVHANEIVVGG